MKKNRLLLLVAAAIWLAVGIQVIMNRLTDREGDILEAFSLTNTDTMESSLIMLAEYPDGFADRNEREEALFTLAEGIGLNIDGPFYEEESDSRSEIGFEKSGRYAATKLSSVRLIGENKTSDYVLLRLTIYEDTDRVLKYKELAEKLYEQNGYEEVQTRMTLTGSREGNLSLEERNRITDRLLEALSGSAAFENRKEEAYTVYAYTARIREYVLSAGKKINIQIGMEYDPDEERTRIIVATPIRAGS